MKQYISKSALVAEIDKRRNICMKIVLDLRTEENKDYYQGKAEAYKETLDLLDSLEVKEVDVEKESELIANSIMISVQANLYHTNVYDYEKRCYKHSDLKDAAKKGIELGLKAQKGE